MITINRASMTCGVVGKGRRIERTSRIVLLLLSATILLGLAIRFYQLADRSLWFDEAFTWRLIRFPFADMFARICRDNSPPLFYILLKCWATVFGDSAFALRSLGVLFGGLTIFGAYLFATEAFANDLLTTEIDADLRTRGRGIGLIAAALVALSAFHIRYSQELRMYTMAAALAVFSSWALFRALRPPSRLRRWLLYGFFALLLAYTHYYGLFTLAAQVVFVAAILLVRSKWNVLQVLRQPGFRHALLTGAVVILAYLPWLPIFLRQRAQVQAIFWSQSTTRWDIALLCYNMFTVRCDYASPPYQRQLLAADVCILILWLLRRGARAAEWYVLGSTLVPLICCLVVSAPVALRYFIMAHVFFLIGLAVVIWRVRFPLERGIVIAAVLAIFAAIYLDYWSDLDVTHRPGARGSTAYLERHRLPGEPVIVCMPAFYFPLLHYTPHRDSYFLYNDGRPMPHFYGTAAMIPEDLITEEQLRGLRSRRVWCVDMAGGFLGVHFVPVPPQWKVKSHQTFTEVAWLGDIIVIEYETGAGQEDK